jgi:hypothetical protein
VQVSTLNGKRVEEEHMTGDNYRSRWRNKGKTEQIHTVQQQDNEQNENMKRRTVYLSTLLAPTFQCDTVR